MADGDGDAPSRSPQAAHNRWARDDLRASTRGSSDFGHHAGRSIVDLANEDPDYLRWLARHPSGMRYRSEIARVLDSSGAARG